MADKEIHLNLSIDASSLGIPRLEDYFGAWAMHEPVFIALAEHVSGMDLAGHVAAHKLEVKADGPGASGRGKPYQVVDGVAVIELRGSLMKQVSSMSDGTSTVAARRAIGLAANDPDVSAILLAIESPGGTVAGTGDLAEAVAAAGKKKPVEAHIEDLGASAAYWIASQADRVSANPTALVGSIGTYMAVRDLSTLAAQQGVKIHVIRAGDFKGSGTPGTEITGPQLTEWQRMINDLNSHFLAGVAKGRKLSAERVAELADGRVHTGAAAKDLGLVDAVESRDATLSRLIQRVTPKSKGLRMSSENAATHSELRAACPGASGDFLFAQLEKGATVAQATGAYIAQLQSQAAAAEEKAKASAEQAKAAAAKVTTEPLGGGVKKAAAVIEGDPIQQWNEGIAAKVAAGMPKHRAAAALAREKPDLRMSMLAAHNQANGRHKAAAALAE